MPKIVYLTSLLVICLDLAACNKLNAQITDIPRLITELESYLEKTDNLWAGIHVESYVGKILEMEPIPDQPKDSLYTYDFEFRRIGNSFWGARHYPFTRAQDELRAWIKTGPFN